MTKFALLCGVAFLTIFMLVPAAVVLAEGGPGADIPAPYAGLKNPFSWNDASVQELGKVIYQRSCLGCHGADGSSIASSDFGAADFPKSLEEKSDYYFWILSEGRLEKGMPPFKSSISEEQRWQVLTYLWSLGRAPAAQRANHPPTKSVAEAGTLFLSVPERTQSGQALTLTAVLQDSHGRPIVGVPIKFFLRIDFFTTGLMEIGQALTNDQGVAVLKYTPRQEGDIEIVARYGDTETTAITTLAEANEPFYHADAGIKPPAPGKEIFIGPESPFALGEGSGAPPTALRLPSGVLSWLSPLLATVITIWLVYFYVIYQVFRIPVIKDIRDTDTRLIPLAGLAIVVALGLLLVLILITGPYSHFHLLR